MTDNEIIKALEICGKGIMFSKHDCKKCPYYTELNCETKCKQNALDLINRQKAENERLKKEICIQHKIIDERGAEVLRHDRCIRTLHEKLETAKAEAIKEVFQAIDFMCIDTFGNFNHKAFINLKKEMVGDNDK